MYEWRFLGWWEMLFVSGIVVCMCYLLLVFLVLSFV